MPRASRKNVKPKATPGYLKMKYEHGKSLPMLAKETGLAVSTVRSRILSVGGEMRSRGGGKAVAMRTAARIRSSYRKQRRKAQKEQ